MLEVRLHGRGGQGSVTSAELFAEAAIGEGKYAQAFPSFGPERRGAPVRAFIRIDDKPIYDKSRIYLPDHVVVVDPTLVEAIDVTEGLKAGGWIIINSDKAPDHFRLPAKFHVATVNATEIAVKHKLGTLAAPIVNTAIVGAVVRLLKLTKLESLLAAIKEAISIKPEDNQKAAAEAYEIVAAYAK